jgi:hypothetical protein
MPCSYCGCWRHNIRLCNDSTITTHYNNIKGIYISIKQSGIDAFREKIWFENAFSTYTIRILKAVITKFVGGSISLSKKGLINRLWDKFFVDNDLQNELDELDERITLPNIPDVIPAYAQDLAINNFEVVQSSDQRLGSDQSSDQRLGSGARVFDLLRNARASRNLQSNTPASAIAAFLEDYVAFSSRNLESEFERNWESAFGRNLESEFGRIDIAKKYNISTCISVTETSEELDKCEDCLICFEETKLLDTVTINCGHKFCGMCIKNTLKMYNNMTADPACAFCRSQITSCTMKNQEIYSLVSEHCIM